MVGQRLSLPPDLKSVFLLIMGRLLDRLLQGSHAYSIKRDADGFVLIGQPEWAEEFNDLVRDVSQKAGDDLIVFTTSDGRHGYSQMYILPMDDLI